MTQNATRTLSMVLAFAAMFSSAAFAEDRADLSSTKIIGNRELPKVLYIVPWKKPTPGELSGRPLVSVLDEAMAPVDRDVFRRQVQYEVSNQTRTAATAGAPPATVAPVTAPQAPAGK